MKHDEPCPTEGNSGQFVFDVLPISNHIQNCKICQCCNLYNKYLIIKWASSANNFSRNMSFHPKISTTYSSHSIRKWPQLYFVRWPTGLLLDLLYYWLCLKFFLALLHPVPVYILLLYFFLIFNEGTFFLSRMSFTSVVLRLSTCRMIKKK